MSSEVTPFPIAVPDRDLAKLFSVDPAQRVVFVGQSVPARTLGFLLRCAGMLLRRSIRERGFIPPAPPSDRRFARRQHRRRCR